MWMLWFFTALPNRGGLSVSVEPNTVCSRPISAAASYQEQQLSFYQHFDASLHLGAFWVLREVSKRTTAGQFYFLLLSFD